MYISLKDLTEEKLKEILKDIGLTNEMLEHKAFNVLLKNIYNIMLSKSIAEIDLNDQEFYVKVSKEEKTFEVKSKNGIVHNLLCISGNEIIIDTIHHSNDKASIASSKFTAMLVSSEIGAHLVTNKWEWYNHKKNNDNALYMSRNFEKREFNVDGIEISREMYLGDNCKIQVTPSANQIHTPTTIPTTGKHVMFRRTAIDTVYVTEQEDNISEHGYAILNNESGLQEMKVSPVSGSHYIVEEVKPISEEDYERKIEINNSEEVKEALRKFSKNERINFSWQEETTNSKTSRR